MESIDTLVVARWIAPVEPAVVLHRHAVAIRSGRIVTVLPEAEARARYAARETIERDHHVVTPGLVDASVDVARTPFRGLEAGLAPDARELRLVALEQAWLGPESVRDAASLAIAEMLAAGTTCFGDTGLYPDVVAATAIDAGIRAVVGLPIADHSTVWAADANEHFDRSLALHDEYRDHPLVATAFVARSVAALHERTLHRLKVLVDQLDTPFAVPLHESVAAIAACRREHGATPRERLERLGLVNASLAAAHATHFGADDVAAAAGAALRVVHTPTLDLARGLGIAPIGALLEAGVEIAVATGRDPPTFGYDLLAQARLAALLAAGTRGDAAAVPPELALRMATLGGAAALGLDGEIGSLAPGKWADLACFDLARLPATPFDEPVPALVHAGARDFVTDTWVAGRHAHGAGATVRLDPADLARRATEWRRRMLAGAGPAARQ